MTNRKGSCLCGAIGITVNSDKTDLGACHCPKCRKWAGGPFFEIECGSDVRIEGSENITLFKSSKRAVRAFCKVCGTHLYIKTIDREEFGISPGLFEDDEGIHFNRQVFFDKKPAYYSFSNSTRNITSDYIYSQYPDAKEENK